MKQLKLKIKIKILKEHNTILIKISYTNKINSEIRKIKIRPLIKN